MLKIASYRSSSNRNGVLRLVLMDIMGLNDTPIDILSIPLRLREMAARLEHHSPTMRKASSQTFPRVPVSNASAPCVTPKCRIAVSQDGESPNHHRGYTNECTLACKWQ
ncbi:hypothetical protein DAPPUDRAFT_255529 [Daphnia pulex]|uniref:Uncharacterized protein n=1 Tax=Daphnia pulex TaxID=6669 RepID=E9H9E7_DAPPU|nr:hypothetical protein DAPPUDRAFT_255529 [Daphnia pulex]|eukprot:EFX71666.1 hypothetical protein DAPPUDRAFT_255529 [Daphnia pulex]